MKNAGYLSFHETTSRIREPVTKFGGQPVWLTKAEWPVSQNSGEPMLFLGQVSLDPEIFDNIQGQMAYLFLPSSDPLYAEPAYEPAKNSVIIQPGGSNEKPTRQITEGPCVCRIGYGKRTWYLLRERLRLPTEFAVSITRRQDPEIRYEDDDDDPWANTPHDLNDSKIGGEPVWIQDEAWPYDDSRALLLQLVWGNFPFHLNLGDAGTLWAFLNKEGTKGTIQWDCY